MEERRVHSWFNGIKLLQNWGHWKATETLHNFLHKKSSCCYIKENFETYQNFFGKMAVRSPGKRGNVTLIHQNIWGEFFRFLWLCVDLEILIRNIVRIEILKIMNKQYHRSSSFAKRTVLDVWQGSEYASIISNIRVINWLIIYWSLLC